MMSKAHIAVGMAAAVAIAQTGSVESCVAAVVGGSVGGIIADCDIHPSRAHKDALIGRLIVVGIAVVALLADHYANAGLAITWWRIWACHCLRASRCSRC